MGRDGDEHDVVKRNETLLSNRPHMYSGVPTIEYDNDKDEKPWQRVPNTLMILLLGMYFLLAYLTQLVEDGMPRVVQETELATGNNDTFSEEAAWTYLHKIAGDEPRVAGTLYHYQKTVELKRLVDSIAWKGRLSFADDWQIASGDYWLNYTPAHVNYYQRVSNVIAVLEGESGFKPNDILGSSILLNCHYDSVPYAIGASDNVVFCAIMMETLSKLSKRSKKFKHNIIFLFNGAEENPLQASHAFLQHEWSRHIVSVVNLDAAGMNGKPNLFQVTDPRVLYAYKRVTPRPNAQSFGEFLFSSGIVPSDTDFRIWRDFGHIYGVDIAFSKWGHVYHTRYDHPDLLKPGVMQCAGDMLFNLVQELANMEELNDKVVPTTAVYYDYLNSFMLAYSASAAHAVDALIVVLAALSALYYLWTVGLRWAMVRELLFSILGRLVSMAGGVVVVAVLVPIMVTTTIQLRYLTQPWIVVAVFWVPYLIGAVATAHALDRWRATTSTLNRSLRALQAMAATRLILAFVLVIMFCIPSMVTMRYIISVPLFIMSVMALVSLTLVRYLKLQGWQHLILELALSIPSTMFMFTMALRINALMLPVMARTPIDSPDYIVAGLNIALAILVPTTVSGIELLFSRRRLWLILGTLSAACVILMFIPMSPYSDDGPSTQRHYWFHTEIITYDSSNNVTERTSGVLITKHDAYSTERVLPALQTRGYRLDARTDFAADCEKYVYCNLPLYRVRFGEYLNRGLFLSTGPPAAFDPPPSVRLSKRWCEGNTCDLEFSIIGAPHNLITMWPVANVTLTSWLTLTSPTRPTATQGGRPVYVVVHSVATHSATVTPIVIGARFDVPPHLHSAPIVELSHHAHRIHHPEHYTEEYQRLLDAMPAYFNIASFMTVRSNHRF